MFFFIHTSFSKLSNVCDVGYGSFRRIIDSIKLDSSFFVVEIELDEMYYKSGLKVRYYSSEIESLGRNPRRRGLKRRKRGRGTYDEDLCPLLSIVNRCGDFLLIPINTASEADIKNEVYKYCDMNSTFYTDEWRSYNFIENRKYVIHSNRQYSKDVVHVNNAEGLHSHFRIFMSDHMGVNKKNLRKYIKYFKIMKEAMKKKTDEEVVKYFISLLVQRRD
jgi:transposase-like protein